MPDSIPHDWFRPRLAALVAEAKKAGIAADVSVAVITDLINGPGFSAPEPAAIDEAWNQDIGEPDYIANETAAGDMNEAAQPISGGGGASLKPGHGGRHGRR